MPLPTVHTIKYNTYQFNETAKTQLVGRPVYDRSGRYVISVVYTLTVTWLVYESTPDGGCKTLMANARYYLNQPGRALIYKDNGFGDIYINTEDSNEESDLVWGPKPGEIFCVPIGNKACWQLTWSCEFCISECATVRLSTYGELPVMALSYNTTWAIDERAATTRTYEGYIQCPTGREIKETADNRRDDIVVPIPVGFQRITQQFKLDDAKTVLTFLIVDREILAEELPFGCFSASGSHSIQNSSPRFLCNWIGRITATYNMLPTIKRSDAWGHFWHLTSGRMEATIEYLQAHPQKPIPNQQNPQDQANVTQPFMISFRVDEGLYQNNRQMTFEVTYAFTTTLKEVAKAAGFWLVVPNTSPELVNNDFTQVCTTRGIAQMAFNVDEDLEVTLCGVAPTKEPTESEEVPIDPDNQGEDSYLGGGYLIFQNEITQEGQSGYVASNLLTDSDRRWWSGMKSKIDDRTYDGWEPPDDPSANGSFSNYVPDVVEGDTMAIQPRVAPMIKIRVRGFAVRAWSPIPVPRLLEFDGKKCIPSGAQYYKQKCIGQSLGTPIFQAEWLLEYILHTPQETQEALLMGAYDAAPSSPGFDVEPNAEAVAPEFLIPKDV